MRHKEPTRGDLQKKVSGLGPALSKATIFFHETLSGRLGLNATDTKCIGFIMNSSAPVTAGDLADFTGLTTGAVTGIIDRLEKAKLLERARDPGDRRRVYLRPLNDGLAKLTPMYSSLRRSVERLIGTYDRAELETIADFMMKSVALLEDEAEKVRRLPR